MKKIFLLILLSVCSLHLCAQLAGQQFNAGNDTGHALFSPSDYVVFVFIILISLFLLSIVSIPFYFNYLKTKKRLDILKQLVREGKEIPLALLSPKDTKRSDLHLAIVLSSIGLGVGLFLGVLFPETRYWSIAVFPLTIALGYFTSHLLGVK